MKQIKIKKFTIGLLALLVALIQFGCEQDWQEEYEPSVLDAANTATVTVNTVEDSTAIIEYSLSTVGRVFIAVVPGTDESETPDPQDMLKLDVADAVFAKQIVMDDAAELSGSVKVSGLIQNTSYKVFALPVNTDGVLGTIATTAAFTTSDIYDPTLDLDAGISPAISSSPAQEIDFAITLTFNEPVILATDFDIQLGYRDPIDPELITWIPVHEDSISISGSAVTIKQMQELITGQYVLLSIAEGAITDRSGNEYAGVTSDFIDDGEGELIPDGIFWRAAWEAKEELTVIPSDTIYVTEPAEFQVIKLEYPIELSTASLDAYEMGMIKVKYYNDELSETFNLDAANLDIDGDTLFVYLPKAGEYGSYVTLSVDEGALWDIYGNDVAAIEFGDYEWFISYGYTRDLIIGDYQVDGTSYFGASYDESFNVTIAEDPDNANQIIATGIYYSDTAVVGVFDGDLATLTFNIPDWIELGDLWGDGASNSLEVYGDDHFVCHIAGTGDMTTDDEYWWGSYWYLDDANQGWNNLFVASTWTKISKAAGVSLDKNASTSVRDLQIKRGQVSRN